MLELNPALPAWLGGCAEARLDLQARDESRIFLRRIEATIVRDPGGIANRSLLQCGARRGG